MTEDQRVLGELLEAVAARRPVVLATVVGTRRSVPRHAGTKMLVYGDGQQTGTVGGGEMESRVIEAAREALGTGKPRLLEYELLEPSRGDPGVCGGAVQIYVEPYMPPHTVFVIGCGHVGGAVVDLAHWLGYYTVAYDDRPEQVSAEAMPNADVRLSGTLPEALAEHDITADTSVVVVSRSVDLDVAAVPLLVQTPARYLGVMGSQRRWLTTRKKLEEAGVASDHLDRIHAPIGLELNAETVEEIAVSIMGEVIRERAEAAGPADEA